MKLVKESLNENSYLYGKFPNKEAMSWKLVNLRDLFVKDGYKVNLEQDKSHDFLAIHVTNRKGYSITFKINNNKIDIIVPGYSDDIFIGTEKINYKYFKELTDSINKKWMKENDPEGEHW